MTRDLSVIIPARNEMFLKRTVEEVLSKRRGNTEVIVILDGAWANPGLDQHPDVTIIYNHKSIGQRASINMGARLSRAKFIMKLDAHCSLDEGFDVKLMADCAYEDTIVPRMYNLHAFDWVCKNGHRRYQSPSGPCNECGEPTERDIVWRAKKSPETDFMRFDSNLKFQYWSGFKKRPEAQADLAPTMSILGACFFLHRQRYWDLDGSDEEHGSWGQQGTEIACKTWLSGGRLLVNKKTWFAHLFRTQGGDFGFPYVHEPGAIDKARQRSQDMWRNNKWPKAKHDLNWLINKFAPVPDWSEDKAQPSKGIIYYTDNKIREEIAEAVRDRLIDTGLPIVSCSLKPIDGFGKNIVLPLERGYLTMAKQILTALENSSADIIFFCEHDVLYHSTHFDFIPPRKDIYYYNESVWKVRYEDGHALHYDCKQLSGLCAYRELLIKHFKERVRRIESEGFSRKMGFEPGTHGRAERIDDYGCDIWESEYPNIDIRHDKNLTPSRWSKDQFRNKRYTKGWTESDEIPGWGKAKDIVQEIRGKEGEID